MNSIKKSTHSSNDLSVSYFESCKSSKPLKTISLFDYLAGVNSKQYEASVKIIRAIQDKTQRDEHKRRLLPGVTISGIFEPTRHNKNLITHSGFIQIDFDSVENLEVVIEQLKKDRFTYACYKSPSGNGIKLIVKIPPSGKTHRASFRALKRHYLKNYNLKLDEACSDVARLLYFSYDPDVFVNISSSEFTELEEVETSESASETKSILDSESLYNRAKLLTQKIIEREILLVKDDEAWNRIGYTLAKNFQERGRLLFHQLSTLRPSYQRESCDKTFDELLLSSWRDISINELFDAAKKQGLDNTPGLQPIVISGIPITDLYNLKRDQKGNVIDVQIRHAKHKELLEAKGLSRFDFGDDFLIVREQKNVLEKVNRPQVQDIFFSTIKELPEVLPDGLPKEILREKFIKSFDTLFFKWKLSLLDNQFYEFCNDTKDQSFVFYSNGFVICAKDGYSFHDYTLLKGKIWKSQILNRKFKSVSVEMEDPDFMGVFAKFIWNISGKDLNRFQSICSIMGYLLHDYFQGKRVAVILTDSTLTDQANGRTGKTLLAVALSRIRSLCNMNGKDFTAEERFKYQSVQLETKIVSVNDLKPNFKIDKVFNDITEGLTVEKKNGHPFRKDVKMMLITNRTIKIEGASAKDRVIEFEFSDHYNELNSPRAEFGKWFFDEGEGWTEQDWTNFDNFMCACISFYMAKGLIKPAEINLSRRKLLDSTDPDFVEFIEERIKNGKIKANQEICKNSLLADFNNENSGNEPLKDVRKISIWLQNFANYSGYFAPYRKKQDETARNSKKYFAFRPLGYQRTTLEGYVNPDSNE